MIADIKKQLEAGKAILGTNTCIKAIRKGELKKLVLASNIDVKTKKEFEKLCKLSKVELLNSEMSNDELGTICKKPFAVAVIGLK